MPVTTQSTLHPVEPTFYDRAWLISLSFLFVVLAVAYSTITPIFENSDEPLHYPVIQHIADGHGLPVARPNQLWNQEGTQPPLYYSIVALTTFWIDDRNLPDFLHENPHWRYTDSRHLLNDNQNRLAHGPHEQFPYQRAALAIQIGRWWSILFGLVMVICTFLLVRHAFPAQLPLAVTTTALVAFNPEFATVSATVSNDSLSAGLTALAVWLAWRWTDQTADRHLTVSQTLVLGLLAGLAVLTKLSSLAVVILVGSIITWRVIQTGQYTPQVAQYWLSRLTVLGGTTIVLTFWWFYRNYRLYGEWLATETHLNLAGRGELSLWQIWQLRAEVMRAYWASFGWGQIRFAETVYQLLGWLMLWGLLGGIWYLVRLFGDLWRERQHSVIFNQHINRLGFVALLVLWSSISLILYLRWVMEVGSVSHTRLMFPALTAISLLLVLGWQTLVPRHWHWSLAITVLTGLLLLNLAGLGLVYEAFNPSGAIKPTALLNNPVDLTYLDGDLRLTFARVANSHTPNQLGDTVYLEAAWKVEQSADKNYSVAAVIQDPNGPVLAHRETYPGLGLRPTRYLQVGRSFTDLYPLQIITDVSEPLVANVTLTFFDYDSPYRAGLPVLNAQGEIVTPIVGQVKITPTVWSTPTPEQSVTADFGDAIRLIGYDHTEVGITLYWQSLADVEIDYVVFIHLLDENDVQVDGLDAPPTYNRYPTSWWAPGETIHDPRSLPLSSQVKSLRLGLYDPTNGQRLSIHQAMLPVQDNSLNIPLIR